MAQEEQKSTSRSIVAVKIIKRVIGIITALIVLISISGFVIVKWYKDDVIKYIVGELNKQMLTKVDVSRIKFSVFEKFPNACLLFEDVKMLEVSNRNVKDNLLSAKKLYLEFNLINIFNKKYIIKNIEIDNGKLNIRLFDDGTVNYNIIKPNNKNTSDAFKLGLEKVKLTEININYHDEKIDFSMNSMAKNIVLNGNFDAADYQLKISGPLFMEKLDYNHVNYMNKKKCSLNLTLDVKNNTHYKFNTASIDIEKMKFDMKGNIKNSTEQTEMDICIYAKELNISSFISILPQKYRYKFNDLNSEGTFYFNCLVKGVSSSKENPVINCSFGIKNAEIQKKGVDAVFRKVNLTGSYFGGNKNKKSGIEISKFEAELDEGHIVGAFDLNDLQNPYLYFKAIADVNLEKVQQFLSADTLESISGEAKLQINCRGSLDAFKSYTVKDIRSIHTTGTLSLNNVSFKLKGNDKKPENIKAELEFNNANIIVKSLTGKVFSSDLSLNGEFVNVLPYLLLDNERLDVKATIKSESLDLAELFAITDGARSNKPGDYNVHFSERVDFDVNANINKLTFKKFEASEINGNLSLHYKKLIAHDLKFNTMNGSVTISGIADASDDKNILVKADGNASRININKLFFQLENFGQTYLQYNNIKGLLTADFILSSEWSNSLEVNADKIFCNSDITIENGELNNFDPVMGLAKFIEVSELKNIRFSTLKNKIEIKNKLIIIPEMNIQSNALNISASGNQTFDGKIDYRFSVLLRDLLAKKAITKKENDEFGETEDDGLGKIILRLSMTGTTENPIFKYDKMGLKKKIKNDLTTERNNLKKIFKEEFGLYKNDSTLNSIDKKKSKEIGIDWDTNGEYKTDSQKKKTIDSKKENKLIKKINKEKPKENNTENSDDFN